MIDINELQRSITLSTDSKVIAENREKLRQAREAVKAQIAMVDALAKANQAICRHPRERSYSDYGGGSSTMCPDCGGCT